MQNLGNADFFGVEISGEMCYHHGITIGISAPKMGSRFPWRNAERLEMKLRRKNNEKASQEKSGYASGSGYDSRYAARFCDGRF